MENISILNQRYWGMRFEFCSRGKIRDIFTNVCCDRRNQDGINLRNGCHDILIENVHGQTGDDTIALSAIDTNRNPAANYIVEGMSWDIHDVIIRNISGAAVNHPLVALRNHNGARIYNITIEDIQDTEFLQYTPKNRFERYGIIRIGNNSYYRIRPSEMGETYNITINNLHFSSASAPSSPRQRSKTAVSPTSRPPASAAPLSPSPPTAGQEPRPACRLKISASAASPSRVCTGMKRRCSISR